LREFRSLYLSQLSLKSGRRGLAQSNSVVALRLESRTQPIATSIPAQLGQVRLLASAAAISRCQVHCSDPARHLGARSPKRE
jgi:hypothetical protein